MLHIVVHGNRICEPFTYLLNLFIAQFLPGSIEAKVRCVSQAFLNQLLEKNLIYAIYHLHYF